MQLHTKINTDKISRLVLGNQTVDKIKTISILIVGVGGIGCELLKNLCKMPIKKITIIDFDTIQLSNLNRQFLFKTNHITKSKSIIAKQQLLKINPLLNIQAIEGSIYEKRFSNYKFYRNFDFIISALDNTKAREYLARNATKYTKILIDAGTSGYNGQSYSSVRFKTSCHNCYLSSENQQNFAVCTIRTKPQKTIHCVVYAKNFYEQFFNNSLDQTHHMKVKILKQKLATNNEKRHIIEIGIQLFNYIFCQYYQIIETNSNQQQNFQFNPVNFQNLINNHNLINNPQKITQNQSQNNINSSLQNFIQSIQTTSTTNPPIQQDSIWSFHQYTQYFIYSFLNLAQNHIFSNKNNNKSQITFKYDNDDINCTLFVYCITNLRVYNFKTQQNKLKYLTYDECRRMVGRIIPAIASTNAIAASLEISQLINHIASYQNHDKQIQMGQYFTISPWIDQKISTSWISQPNINCDVCSLKNFYFFVEVNLETTTFEQFQLFAEENCLSYKRDLYCQDLIIIKNQKIMKKPLNRQKKLNFKQDLIVDGTLQLMYLPNKSISDTKIVITLVNKQTVKNQKIFQDSKEKKFKIVNEKQIKRQKDMYCQWQQRQRQRMSKSKEKQIIIYNEQLLV